VLLEFGNGFLIKTDMAGILIIAHTPLASALCDAATHVYAKRPDRIFALDIEPNADVELMLAEAKKYVNQLKAKNGVLVLTDVFGATPANIATQLVNDCMNMGVRGLSGVNLPMLLRALNYRQHPIELLMQKASAGGNQGIMHMGNTAVQNQPLNTHRNAPDRNNHHQ
jgi:mannose PTS system EIIA component